MHSALKAVIKATVEMEGEESQIVHTRTRHYSTDFNNPSCKLGEGEGISGSDSSLADIEMSDNSEREAVPETSEAVSDKSVSDRETVSDTSVSKNLSLMVQVRAIGKQEGMKGQ